MKRIGEIILLLLCASIDRLTKWWALSACREEWNITSWFSCELAYNTGVSFSLGSGGDAATTMMIVSMGTVLIIFCCYRFVQSYHAQKSLLPWGLVIVGAVSNFIDRFFYEGVIDFIVMHYADWCWPTYNIADMCICIGVVLVVATKDI